MLSASCWSTCSAEPDQGAVAVYSPGGPDQQDFGAASGYPIAQPFNSQHNLIGNYSNSDALYPTRSVQPASNPVPLKRASPELDLSYQYKGISYTLQDYLNRNPTTGLLIARDDTIEYEHYQYGRTSQNRFMSQQMATTLLSMLVGIAVSEGLIHSIEENAQDYVPELSGSEIGRTSIRALLHNASGLQFSAFQTNKPDDEHKLAGAIYSAAGADP